MQLSKWGGEKSAQPLIPKVNIEHVMKNQESSFEPLIMIRFLLVHVVAFAMTFSFRLNFIMFELIWISNQHFIIMWIGTSFVFCCVVHENFSISRTLWTSSFLPPSPLSLLRSSFTSIELFYSFICSLLVLLSATLWVMQNQRILPGKAEQGTKSEYGKREVAVISLYLKLVALVLMTSILFDSYEVDPVCFFSLVICHIDDDQNNC